MIWLKGFIFLIGILFLYKAGKQLLTIAKQKQQQEEHKKQTLVKCQQCGTHVAFNNIQEYKGQPYCNNCRQKNE